MDDTAGIGKKETTENIIESRKYFEELRKYTFSN